MSNLPPSGEIPRGAIRFNTDSNKPELWDGSQWAEFQLSTPNLGRGVDTEPGARGVIHEGNTSGGNTNTLSYLNISSTGDALNFGDLSVTRGVAGSCSSSTRGIWGGGFESPSVFDTIDFVNIASTGDATDFGNLLAATDTPGAHSNETRGLFGGGSAPSATNTIQYVTISSTGNAVDFGDLTRAHSATRSSGNSVRAVWFGGGSSNVIDFVTISTLGNAQEFGDLDGVKNKAGGCSSKTRIVIGGGYNPSPSLTQFNTIQYITIMTTGNATNFGDLTQKREGAAAISNSIRGLFAGGYDGPSPVERFNIIDYVNIATQGDAVDFGDVPTQSTSGSGCSNAHGGL